MAAATILASSVPVPQSPARLDLHAVIDRISTGSFSMRRVISERVPLTKPVFRNPRYPLEKPAGKERRDGIVGRG